MVGGLDAIRLLAKRCDFLGAGVTSRSGASDGGRLRLSGPDPVAPYRIGAGPRVGVSVAADVPWRFWLTGDPTVSVYRAHKARTTRPVSQGDIDSV